MNSPRASQAPDTGIVYSAPLKLATAQTKCSNCQSTTPVFAIIAASEEEFDEGESYGRSKTPVYVTGVPQNDMPEEVSKALAELAPNFCPVYTKALDETNWANECVECGTLQSTFALHSGAEGAFLGKPSQFRGPISNLPDVDIVVR